LDTPPRPGFIVAREFVEVETDKGSDALDRRPQLKAARRRSEAAKLDRLAATCFISGLMAHKAPFHGRRPAPGRLSRLARLAG
jgi:hypothetical protein